MDWDPRITKGSGFTTVDIDAVMEAADAEERGDLARLASNAWTVSQAKAYRSMRAALERALTSAHPEGVRVSALHRFQAPQVIGLVMGMDMWGWI